CRRLVSLLAPDLLHPPVTTASLATALVAGWILLVVVLVVLLGRPELRRRHDPGDDCLLQLLLRGRLALLRGCHLVLADRVDGGGVAVAAVAELPVRISRIDRVKEIGDELVVGEARVVEQNRDGLAVTGGRMVEIGRIGGRATDITRGGRQHAGKLVEIGLDRPERAAGEDRRPLFSLRRR